MFVLLEILGNVLYVIYSVLNSHDLKPFGFKGFEVFSLPNRSGGFTRFSGEFFPVRDLRQG